VLQSQLFYFILALYCTCALGLAVYGAPYKWLYYYYYYYYYYWCCCCL